LGEKLDSGNVAWVLGYRNAVPQKIAGQGNAAVLRYVKERVARHKARLVHAQTLKSEKLDATHVLIEVEHDGVLLKGHIIKRHEGRGGVEIRLESPKKYAASDTIEMCYGLAMAHKSIFTRHGAVSDWVIEDAEEFFVQAYERKQREEKLSPRFKFVGE